MIAFNLGELKKQHNHTCPPPPPTAENQKGKEEKQIDENKTKQQLCIMSMQSTSSILNLGKVL